jgi:hypothetical protein
MLTLSRSNNILVRFGSQMVDARIFQGGLNTTGNESPHIIGQSCDNTTHHSMRLPTLCTARVKVTYGPQGRLTPILCWICQGTPAMVLTLTSEFINSEPGRRSLLQEPSRALRGVCNLPILPTFYSTPHGGVRAHLGGWTTWIQLLVSLV